MSIDVSRYITPAVVNVFVEAGADTEVGAEYALRVVLPSILARHRRDVRRETYCGCAWCCAGTRPEDRGEAHQRTCHPEGVAR